MLGGALARVFDLVSADCEAGKAAVLGQKFHLPTAKTLMPNLSSAQRFGTGWGLSGFVRVRRWSVCHRFDQRDDLCGGDAPRDGAAPHPSQIYAVLPTRRPTTRVWRYAPRMQHRFCRFVLSLLRPLAQAKVSTLSSRTLIHRARRHCRRKTPIHIINPDNEATVCYSTDGSMPTLPAVAAPRPLTQAAPFLSRLRFQLDSIVWSSGSDEANYKVESDARKSSCDPVIPWPNQELARAYAVYTDEVKCMLNNCQNPSSTGNWSTKCDSGQGAGT